jgi:hypothetical protein
MGQFCAPGRKADLPCDAFGMIAPAVGISNSGKLFSLRYTFI